MTKSRAASRYRDDAASFRERAAAASDDADLRNSYLAVAREFDRLAELLEEERRSPPTSKSADTHRSWLRMLRRRRRQQRRVMDEDPLEPERATDGCQPLAIRTATVLVIDADPAVRLAVKKVLDAAGLTVIAVPGAAAALERLAVLRADLVLCDIDASAPDGRSAINAVVAVDPAVQILTLASKYRHHTGVLSFIGTALEKPFTPSELLSKVRRALVGSPPLWPELY